MRLWSIHPKYLDGKRLTAQWREALLCRACLEGKTKGYLKHPQYLRVKHHQNPLDFINKYLYTIYDEAFIRGYKFDHSKIGLCLDFEPMEVTESQADYEFTHLQKKLGEFDEQYSLNEENLNEDGLLLNDCFILIPGPIMDFEKIKK
jgi:hypothetical protein